MLTPKPNNRNRRKSNQGLDHAKHRRTRSGCYTCRSRRVKCDEMHPVCERCKKGGRDCVYPESVTHSKDTESRLSKSAKVVGRTSTSSSSEEYDVDGTSEQLELMPDQLDATVNMTEASNQRPSRDQHNLIDQSSSGHGGSARHSSETPSLIQDKGTSPTPSTEGSVGYPVYPAVGKPGSKEHGPSPATSRGELRIDWSHLPPDLQYYLAYFCDHVTYLHYSLKFDSEDFLRTRFLSVALNNRALLYAVVGFSAFHCTLQNPSGRMQDFLQYYNKAVSLLLHSLKKGERHDHGTILAILQLATIEEFLGDWINLLGHQKAAFEILTEIYTPNSIMQDQMSRVILGWYMRFDVFAGLLGGFQTVLSREWFSHSQEFYQSQVARDPANLNWKIEYAIAQVRLVAMDMTLLFASMGKGEISREQFISENMVIGQRIEEWKTKMHPALQDKRFLIKDFPDARPLDPDDIVNPYLPGIVYNGPLWVMNIVTIDWMSIDLMHKYQTALTLQTQPSAELGGKSYASCQLFEAVELLPESPPGTILACQASLGIACLFLPRDQKHAMWARRKLATIEANGYIYPYTFRTKMADLFRDRSCMHWWLPNEEGYPPIIRSIRAFVEERTSPAKDLPTEDLRDMKAIFSSLRLDDGQPSNSASSEERTNPLREPDFAKK